MQIKKIVITGGPCGGKSTAMPMIGETAKQEGWVPLFIAETATELIAGGVAPWTCASPYEYQTLQLRLQLVKEDIFDTAARGMNAQKLLIVCDRGVFDSRAYMTEEAFDASLSEAGFTRTQMLARYDAVFHLTTAAKGALPFYTTLNNPTRKETPEEAAALDDRVLDAWKNHPCVRVFDNAADFEHKLLRLTDEIRRFLRA